MVSNRRLLKVDAVATTKLVNAKYRLSQTEAWRNDLNVNEFRTLRRAILKDECPIHATNRQNPVAHTINIQAETSRVGLRDE